MNRQSPHTQIPGLAGQTLGDFWSWAYSDLLSNVNRAAFAEFLVAAALGLLDFPRIEWDAVDLRYRDKAIEVKAAAYLQSWPQERPSAIRFGIAKTRAWDARTNTYSDVPTRSADCYVFCLYAETDPAAVNVLDVARWHFYVLPTEQINLQLGEQKTVGLHKVQAMCTAVCHEQLKARIDSALALEPTGSQLWQGGPVP